MGFEAVVFPGQGAQKKGMASDFVEQYSESQAIFDTAAKYLDFDVAQTCVEENDLLGQTKYTQPCILTAEIAMLTGLKQEHGDEFAPQWFAGHSLGEYAALVAAEVLPFDVAIQLVKRRGELMQDTNVAGGMAAVIIDPLPLSDIAAMAAQHQIDVANDNSSSQVVLSGEKSALSTLVSQLESSFAAQDIRCVMLNVSAPFHSRYMQPIEEAFLTFLSGFKDSFVEANAPKVASNFLGRFYYADKDEIISALAKQLSSGVKWRDNMAALISKTQSILELGPNRPLRGFFQTMDVNINSVINLRSAKKVFA